jgi:hypothetical protein
VIISLVPTRSKLSVKRKYVSSELKLASSKQFKTAYGLGAEQLASQSMTI